MQVALGDLQREGQSVLIELALPPRGAGDYRLAQAEVNYDIPGGGAGQKATADIVFPFVADPTAATAVNGAVMNTCLLYTSVPLRAGDRVVLCSPAAAEAVGDGQLLTYVAEQRAPREAAARLIALTRERGATDDVSVVVAFVRAAPLLSRGQAAALLVLGAAAVGAVGWLVWEVLRYWQGGG